MDTQEIITFIESLKRQHYYCEDPWYSCPLAEDGCADDSQVGCNCGADKFNQRIDEFIKRLKGGE